MNHFRQSIISVWEFLMRHSKIVFIAQLLLLTVLFGLILMELVER